MGLIVEWRLQRIGSVNSRTDIYIYNLPNVNNRENRWKKKKQQLSVLLGSEKS